MMRRIVVLDFECPTGCGSCCIEPRVRGCQPFQADGKCKHLGSEGCALLRENRPIACREYLCNPAQTYGTEEWVARNVGVGSAFQKHGIVHYIYSLDGLYYLGITRTVLESRKFRCHARKLAELIYGFDDVTATIRPSDPVLWKGKPGQVTLNTLTLLTKHTVTVEFEDGSRKIVPESELHSTTRSP